MGNRGGERDSAYAEQRSNLVIIESRRKGPQSERQKKKRKRD